MLRYFALVDTVEHFTKGEITQDCAANRLGSVRISLTRNFLLLGPKDCHRQFHAFYAAICNVPFVEQVIEIRFDGTRGYAQSLGDLGVFATLEQQLQDPVFTSSDLDSVLWTRLCRRPFQTSMGLRKLQINESGQLDEASRHIQQLLWRFFDYIKGRSDSCPSEKLFRWKKATKLRKQLLLLIRFLASHGSMNRSADKGFVANR